MDLKAVCICTHQMHKALQDFSPARIKRSVKGNPPTLVKPPISLPKPAIQEKLNFMNYFCIKYYTTEAQKYSMSV